MTEARKESAAEKVQGSTLPRKGDVLAGKYLVDEVIGQGAMGIVVAARHLELRQDVAIKFMLPEVFEQPDAVNRFLREARAVAQMHGNHVTRVSDVGRLDSGTPYMVMERLVGSDLRDVLGRRKLPFDMREAVGYVLQACEGVAEAHALGIVHRDLKPANLFLSTQRDGSPLVKVLDFGILKSTRPEAREAGAVSVTSTTALLGSPSYMSPEQVRSAKNVDARTDIWSLGVILHEFLTGKPAFEGETVSATLAQIAADRPSPLRASRPEVPVELERTVLWCLEKDPDRRLPNVAVLARALAPFAPPEMSAAAERIATLLGSADVRALVVARQEPVMSGSAGEVTASALGRTRKGERRWPGAAFVALTGLLLLVAAVLFQYFDRPPAATTVRGDTAVLPPAASTSMAPVQTEMPSPAEPPSGATASIEARRKVPAREPRAKPSEKAPRAAAPGTSGRPASQSPKPSGDLFSDTQ